VRASEHPQLLAAGHGDQRRIEVVATPAVRGRPAEPACPAPDNQVSAG
jgi:hypothetical protein